MRRFTRRGVMAGALALAACERQASSQPAPGRFAPLRTISPFPIGVCARAEQLGDPAWTALAAAQCSQLTPEWELKMEYVVQPDGGFRFDAPDRLAAFARDNGMRFFGHTLVWYAQKPPAFERLDETRLSFAAAFDAYVATVVGRYRGQACGWDVVNEAVAEDGEGWRDSLWAQKLGALDHMRRAFDRAKAADPQAVLFLNDYNLESLPRKLATYQRLVERLLASGAPLEGLGCQAHLAAHLPAGAMRKAISELARFGLPIHVSELDVSIARARGVFTSRAEKEKAQARLYGETAEAFAALPNAQRFALSLWGLRDRDSWLLNENASDTPAAFDDLGQPKPAAYALAAGVTGGTEGP